MDTFSPGLGDMKLLEEKIGKLIQRQRTLKEDNRRLSEELTAARSQLEEMHAKLEEVRRELAGAKEERRDFAKEKTIRNKLSALLERLEELDV